MTSIAAVVTLDDKLVSLIHGAAFWAACVVPPLVIYSHRSVTRALFGYAAGLGTGVVVAFACFVLLATGKDTFGSDLLQAFGLPLIGLVLSHFGGKRSPPRRARTVPVVKQSVSPWTGAPFETTTPER